MIRLSVPAYVWMGICGLCGAASFFYGILRAEDLFFWASFWIWGAAMIPLAFAILYRILELVFSSTSVIITLLVVVGLGVGVYFLRGANLSSLPTLLQNRNFIILMAMIVLCITAIVVIAIVVKLFSSYFGGTHIQQEVRMEIDRDLDMAELDASRGLELRKLELENQVRMAELQLEAERIKLESSRLQIEQAKLKELSYEPRPENVRPPSQPTPNTNEVG